jgi:hypothetical protein
MGAMGSCFRNSQTKPSYSEPLDNKIYQVSREHKISILPIVASYDIENLYPLTDQVHLWNTFVIGNDKTYILANICDSAVAQGEYIDQNELLNKKANGIIPMDFSLFMDVVWDKTLTGKQMQFFMVWNSRLFFTNTYPLFNGSSKVIGAVMFMRSFQTLPQGQPVFEFNSGTLKKSDQLTCDLRESEELEASITEEIVGAE